LLIVPLLLVVRILALFLLRICADLRIKRVAAMPKIEQKTDMI